MHSTKPRVLIIDDAPDSARTLAMLLTTATGAATQVVTDPRLALDAFAEFHPAVLLLDLTMPGLDGIDLCQAIRAFPAAEAVMIIVVSAHNDNEYKRRAIEAGANYYFVKPADPERLIDLVKSVTRDG